jgi:transposase
VASHPRFEFLWFPTYCPRANPIERVFGDVHDKCTRHHQRQRLCDLGQDIKRPVEVNGPWQYRLSQLYNALEITAAVEPIAAEAQAKIAA